MRLYEIYDRHFLERTLAVIDAELERLDRRADGEDDPDGSGLLELVDHLIGFGFVSCQVYIRAVIASHRLTPRQVTEGWRNGPPASQVAMIWDLANEWKHADERPESGAAPRYQPARRDRLEKYGVKRASGCVHLQALGLILGARAWQMVPLVSILDAWQVEAGPTLP